MCECAVHDFITNKPSKTNKSYSMCYIRKDAIGSFRNFTTKLEEKQTERIDQNVNFDNMQYL